MHMTLNMTLKICTTVYWDFGWLTMHSIMGLQQSPTHSVYNSRTVIQFLFYLLLRQFYAFWSRSASITQLLIPWLYIWFTFLSVSNNIHFLLFFPALCIDACLLLFIIVNAKSVLKAIRMLVKYDCMIPNQKKICICTNLNRNFK